MSDTHQLTPPVVHLTGPWHKSTLSDQNACVEVAPTTDGVAVRDSKNPDGAILQFTRKEWAAFLAAAASGEFDQ